MCVVYNRVVGVKSGALDGIGGGEEVFEFRLKLIRVWCFYKTRLGESSVWGEEEGVDVGCRVTTVVLSSWWGIISGSERSKKGDIVVPRVYKLLWLLLCWLS